MKLNKDNIVNDFLTAIYLLKYLGYNNLEEVPAVILDDIYTQFGLYYTISNGHIKIL